LKKGGEIIVKIADDLNKVIFSNGSEHYMLNNTSQDNFPWIKDKFVRNVINWEEAFFLVTSKDYDRDIDILHTENQEFNVSYKRCIEPGIMKVYDSMIYKLDEHTTIMKTLTKIGDYLYMDECKVDLCPHEHEQVKPGSGYANSRSHSRSHSNVTG